MRRMAATGGPVEAAGTSASASATEAASTLMPRPAQEDRCAKPRPAGFTIFELAMVLLVVLTVVVALTPAVNRNITHARVNRAANVVAAQFYQAQSMAGRQRKPVTLTVSPGGKTITIADAGTGTAFFVRRFGSDSEFNLVSLSASPAAKVYVYPNGMANVSDTVLVGDASYRQKVYLSKAGQIRILR